MNYYYPSVTEIKTEAQGKDPSFPLVMGPGVLYQARHPSHGSGGHSPGHSAVLDTKQDIHTGEEIPQPSPKNKLYLQNYLNIRTQH